MSALFGFLNRLLFPPHCAGCGICLTPCSQKPPLLCETCERAWERELRAQCPKCHADYPDCDCMPRAMQQARISHFVKLTPYGEGAERRITRHMILSMKKAPRERLCTFLATALEPGIQAALDECACEAQDAVLLHLPRNKRAVRRYGVDQAKELARAISSKMGIAYVPLLRRVKNTKAQKKLSEKERLLNLVNAFAIQDAPSAKCAIIVDDVVTTGAGMSVAAKLLLAAGVKQVICVAVAYTEKKK